MSENLKTFQVLLLQNNNKKHAESTGAHPTFEEFVDYVIEEKNAGRKVDDHFSDYNWLCWPCSIDYDVIAHTETLQEDVKFVTRILILNFV